MCTLAVFWSWICQSFLENRPYPWPCALFPKHILFEIGQYSTAWFELWRANLASSFPGPGQHRWHQFCAWESSKLIPSEWYSCGMCLMLSILLWWMVARSGPMPNETWKILIAGAFNRYATYSCLPFTLSRGAHCFCCQVMAYY